MESFCQERRCESMCAFSISCGSWQEVGHFAHRGPIQGSLDLHSWTERTSGYSGCWCKDPRAAWRGFRGRSQAKEACKSQEGEGKYRGHFGRRGRVNGFSTRPDLDLHHCTKSAALRSTTWEIFHCIHEQRLPAGVTGSHFATSKQMEYQRACKISWHGLARSNPLSRCIEWKHASL